jgi:hypothetical protein
MNMPRGIKRRPKVRTEWTLQQRRQLADGLEFFQGGFGRWPGHPVRPLDLDAVRTAWSELGPEILDEFVAAHPYQRPWGWWVAEAPEPRREAEDGDDADPCIFGTPRWWAEYREGSPTQLLPPGQLCESQRAYLVRLGLLTVEERELIRRERHRRANP